MWLDLVSFAESSFLSSIVGLWLLIEVHTDAIYHGYASQLKHIAVLTQVTNPSNVNTVGMSILTLSGEYL